VAVLEFFTSEPLSPDDAITLFVAGVATQLGAMIERKRTEAALRTSEERFRLLVESLDDHAVFMLDRDGCVASWNIGAQRITGYPADDILGSYLSRFYPSEMGESGDSEQYLEEAVAEGRFEHSTWLARRDGLRYRAEVVITALRNGDPAPHGFGCVIRDVTERTRVEQELRRLRALAEGSRDAVFSMTTARGAVTSWNGGAERLFGYRAREVLGRPFSSLCAEDGKEALARLLDSGAGHMRRAEGQLRLSRKNGSAVDVALTITPARDSNGSNGELAVVARDITERMCSDRYMAHALGTYLDRDIADHILREGPKLKARNVDVTTMFVDVRGFTAFAEQFEPTEVVETLNCLFDLVVPIVAECHGHVDKFVGDGLLAVFGTPEPQPDHADQALRAAIRIAREAQRRFEGDLEIGIGIDSGSVVAGNVGGGGRLDFTVIGDAVNTAARIETATRDTGDTILFSDQTRIRLSEDEFPVVPRGGVPIKGKREPVLLYSLDCESNVNGRLYMKAAVT
jgi:PAS domain S-box-containing protein